MSYVVIDKKEEKEFSTLEEAVKFRGEMPLAIFKKEAGELRRIPMEELSNAVQKEDYPEMKGQLKGHRANLTIVLLLSFLCVMAVFALAFPIIKEAMS